MWKGDSSLSALGSVTDACSHRPFCDSGRDKEFLSTSLAGIVGCTVRKEDSPSSALLALNGACSSRPSCRAACRSKEFRLGRCAVRASLFSVPVSPRSSTSGKRGDRPRLPDCATSRPVLPKVCKSRLGRVSISCSIPFVTVSSPAAARTPGLGSNRAGLRLCRTEPWPNARSTRLERKLFMEVRRHLYHPVAISM